VEQNCFLTSNKAYAKTMHLSEKAYAKGGCIIWVNFLGCAHAHLVFLDLGEKVCHPAREVVEFFIRCHALLHPTLAQFSCEKKKKPEVCRRESVREWQVNTRSLLQHCWLAAA
jgi:hypothetical protein